MSDTKQSPSNKTARTELVSAEQQGASPVSRRNFIRWGATALGVAASVPFLERPSVAGQRLPSAAAELTGVTKIVPPAEPSRKKGVEAFDQEMGQLVSPIQLGSRMGDIEVMAITVDQNELGIVKLADKKGRSWDVEICRRASDDGNLRPLIVSREYNVFLRNNGSGSTRTDEQVGRAVITIGSRVRANEKSVPLLRLTSRKQHWRATGYRARG